MQAGLVFRASLRIFTTLVLIGDPSRCYDFRNSAYSLAWEYERPTVLAASHCAAQRAHLALPQVAAVVEQASSLHRVHLDPGTQPHHPVT